MERREFTRFAMLFLGGLVSSVASVGVLTKKASAASAVVPAVKDTNDIQATQVAKDLFYITYVTTFPYSMSAEEYKTVSRAFKDDSYNENKLEDLKREKKFLRMESLLETDKVTTCFEFCNEAAWKEYVQIFDQNKSNSAEKKKQLGFTTTKEFKKSLMA